MSRTTLFIQRTEKITAIVAMKGAYMKTVFEKIIEKLEENASRYTKKYLTPYGNNGYRDVKAISIHKAIEIVKQGGKERI